ncbi:hypothetical protein SPI_03438 [Niveomyces insectorum RCEF 264]|uniref:Uncharacterized protein n=1 Tax=Niveomyces insectorum RCEF 264 TaxID=1081102 RepID=A0A167W315_9HYPO|nr:hypothetical protein SPI_03438 [Niveomyces insectorum RCEF 264]
MSSDNSTAQLNPGTGEANAMSRDEKVSNSDGDNDSLMREPETFNRAEEETPNPATQAKTSDNEKKPKSKSSLLLNKPGKILECPNGDFGILELGDVEVAMIKVKGIFFATED